MSGGYRWRPGNVDVRTPYRLAPHGSRLELVTARGKVDRYRVLDAPFRCCGRFQPPFLLLAGPWELLPWGRQARAECPRCRRLVGYIIQTVEVL